MSPNTLANLKSGEDTYSSAIVTAHRYAEWILSPFKPYLQGKIVEVGIGHGGYYEAVRKYGEYWGIDIDERSIELARERHPDGNFFVGDICDPAFMERLLPEKADSVVSINVLEHVENDLLAINNLVAGLRQGGWLLVNVPAHQCLYNDLDRLAGHFRRYSVVDFSKLLERVPVRTVALHYFNPLGAIGWWANRFRCHESLNSGSVNTQIEVFEKYVLPVSRAVDPLTRQFFGQSLICIAQRL